MMNNVTVILACDGYDGPVASHAHDSLRMGHAREYGENGANSNGYERARRDGECEQRIQREHDRRIGGARPRGAWTSGLGATSTSRARSATGLPRREDRGSAPVR